MTPLKDNVLIQLDPEVNQTAAGIYLKKEWDTLPPTGTVTAIGPDVSAVKVGDHVLFMQYASIETDDADIRVCKEDHIVGILDE